MATLLSCAVSSSLVASFFQVVAFAKEPAVFEVRHGECTDELVAEAAVEPDLNSVFFGTVETRWKPWIVESREGDLEDTSDGVIDADDLLRVELTANCISSHQGEHRMDFCDAVKAGNGVELAFHGGFPAYLSSLTVTIDAKRRFTCGFKADYPSSPVPLRWKVTKKAMKLKAAVGEEGSRLRGWISVEFDEIDTTSGSVRRHKIEGYFKPVIQSGADAVPANDE